MENTNPQAQPAPRGKQKDKGETSVVNPESRKPGSKAQGRKRTKSGCLTCRKRRIKCGEERPTCLNCTKSRRQCEGYNQRVVFKDPISTYRGPSGATSVRVSSSGPSSSSHSGESSQRLLPAPTPLAIASKPPGSLATTSDARPAFAVTPSIKQGPYIYNTKENDMTTRHFTPHSTLQLENNLETKENPRSTKPRTEKSSEDEVRDGSSTHRNFDKGPIDHLPTASAPGDLPGWSGDPTTIATSTSYIPYAGPSNWSHTSAFLEPARTSVAAHSSSHSAFSTKRPASAIEGTPQESYDHSQFRDQDQLPGYPAAGIDPERNLATVPAVWNTDIDDPFDVSDEDTDADDGPDNWQNLPPDSHTRNSDLGTIVALQAGHVNHDLTLRSITSFIDRPNMLATYIPSLRSSPLNDTMTARIFCHFINVIGPTISMFERHPANPSLMFQGHPIPTSQQHIWTYTFPTLAFYSDGLLHAILAMASLHISLLQGTHITASLKHYAISLRRVGKSVSNPTRRGQPATLAAAMLLAYYECWGADHQKWSNHLLGASMLIREIDFAGMSRYIGSMKAQQRHQENMQQFPASQQGFHQDAGRYERSAEDVDENIIGMLMGKRIRYDEYGQIIDDDIRDSGASRSYSQQELQDYETQRDLFWWYCKLDVYHSILGGGRLYMEYDRWNHCPPRAPLGRLNATYGTFDHVVLLMGRVADFAAKDLKRKKLVLKMNAGQRPPEATSMPNQAGQRGPQMPPFSGMVPGNYQDTLPMGFQEAFRDHSPQSSHSDSIDLEAWRIEAEEEWQDIMNCFSVLEDHFGEDFQALGPEFSRPIQTPFGTALQYRTYGIAGIWMNYYTALITCHRVHPSMPPAAMVAAGIAARQTASFANELGRIAAGIAPDCSRTAQVSPGVGAALIESSFCLFIAGVQYQNAGHRSWLVNRLRDIARLTGWQSALSVVHGCEATWIKVAGLGRGPPYSKTTDDREVPIARRNQPRVIDRAMGSGDGRFVVRESERAHYALGLLGVEEDFDNLVMDDDG